MLPPAWRGARETTPPEHGTQHLKVDDGGMYGGGGRVRTEALLWGVCSSV